MSFMERLNGQKTKLGLASLELARQLPPGKFQTGFFVFGSLLTGVGVADMIRKIILGLK